MNRSDDRLPVESNEYIQIPQTRCLHGECPCERSRHCGIWTEYQIAMASLHDSEELSRENWLEITRLRECRLSCVCPDKPGIGPPG